MQDDEAIGLINLNKCAAINAGGRFGEIIEFYIKPEFRSRSVGKELLHSARDFAKNKGWSVLEVGAPSHLKNPRTFDFYLRNGFSEIGPRLELSF